MKIFISSTYRDLRGDRWDLLISLKKAGFEGWGMEFFAADPGTPKEVCLREVRSSNLIILIVGNSYGSVDQETGKSFTHLEYEEAKNSNINILGFIKPRDGDEADNVKLAAFRKQVEAEQTVDYFTDPLTLRDCVWPAFVKYLRERGEISRKVTVFQSFVDFFERFLNEAYLFNHSHKLVGRETELGHLKSFIQSASHRFAVVNGPGGVGKSKLLYEFFNVCVEEPSELEVRFLSAQTEFQVEALSELPAKKVCIVIEDAHKRDDLEAVIDALIRSQYKDRTKLVISMRPSGVDSIKHVLASYDPKEVVWIDVLALDRKTCALNLARNILEVNYHPYAEKLVHASDGNSLIITVGGLLIKRGQIEVTLVESKDFRDRVLEKLLEDSQLGLPAIPNLDATYFLATLAGIGPANITSKELREILTDHFGTAWVQLSGLIDKLEERSLLLRRGRKIRVCPDVLADYVLLSKALSNHREPTGFTDELFDRYGKLYFSNILRNIAEVEYSIQLKGGEASLLNNIWNEMRDFVKQASYLELSELLDKLEPTAVFKPKETFEMMKWLLEPNNLVKQAREGPWKGHINEETVLRKIPTVLRKIAWHPGYTTEVCEILWELANGSLKRINPNPHPEHPFRIFTELAKLDNHNYFSIVDKSLEAVANIIDRGKHRKTHYKIQEILEGTLSQEIENTSYNRRTFTLSFTRIFSCQPLSRIKQVRNRAIELLERLSKDDDPEVILRTANSLINMLYIQRRGPTSHITDEEIQHLTEEAERALKILDEILSANRSRVVSNVIKDKLRSPEKHFMKTIRDKLNSVIQKYEPRDLAYNVQYCMSHDWAEYVLDEGHDITEKRFRELQMATARELWNSCNNDPKELVSYIRSIIEALAEASVGCEARTFQDACARVNQDKIPYVIKELLGVDDIYLAFSIALWFPHIALESKYSVATEIVNRGKTQHKRGLAAAAYSFKGMSSQEIIDVTRRIANDPDKDVRAGITYNLGRIYKDCGQLAEIKGIICEFDTGEDPQLLDSLLQVIDKRFGLDPKELSKQQVERLLGKIESVESLGRNHYRIGEFIAHVRNKSPKALVEMFLRRVKRSIDLRDKKGVKEEFQPFPYTGFSYPGPTDVTGHSDFKDCIHLIVDTVARNEWEYHFWCPKIFKWLVPNFTEKSRGVLKDILSDASEAKTIGIACLLEDYESGIIFVAVDFVCDLLTKAADINKECYRKACSRLASGVFSGSWAESPPGEPSAHWIGIAESCNAVFKRQGLPKLAHDFYRSIKDHAEELNRQKLKEDKIEQEEEEI